MSSLEETIEDNMYYKMFQSCPTLTICPDFGGGVKEEKVQEQIGSTENLGKLPEAKRFDDFNWDDNMNEAYR